MAEKRQRKQAEAERDTDDGDRDEPGGDERVGDEPVVDEQELASYLEERIKPGLNRGAIPLLARSIAREIARVAYHSDEEEEDAEAEDEEPADLEAHLHELQQRLGDDWPLLYGVHGGEAWL